MAKHNGAAAKNEGPLGPAELQALERQVAEAGKNGLRKVLDGHFEDVQKAQDKYELTNTELLSSTLVLNKDVAKSLRDKVQGLGATLRAALEATADAFERNAFKSVDDAIGEFRLAKFQLKRVQRIYDAERAIHHSYESLRLALQVFMALNSDLLAEIEKARSDQKHRVETDLLLKNAVLVYELANTIVGMLEGFDMKGKEDFLAIKQEMMAEIAKNREEIATLSRQADGKDVAPNLRDQTKRLLQDRQENLSRVQQAWGDEERRISEIQSQCQSVQRQIANLKLIRDNAKNQLGFLEILTVTQMMRQNMDAVQGLLAVNDIPLAPLRPEDVCRLLNIEIRGSLQP